MGHYVAYKLKPTRTVKGRNLEGAWYRIYRYVLKHLITKVVMNLPLKLEALRDLIPQRALVADLSQLGWSNVTKIPHLYYVPHNKFTLFCVLPEFRLLVAWRGQALPWLRIVVFGGNITWLYLRLMQRNNSIDSLAVVQGYFITPFHHGAFSESNTA